MILRILKRDFKNIIKNPSVLALIIGLCFLPSLYAWINIKVCWDPYANTSRLPIAVVNNDEGASFNGKNINVGNEIVDNLKKNNSIDWIFIDEWQGNYRLNSGKYYALIEIPNDFSRKLLTLATENPEKPNIIYRLNEKLNGIANKIIDAAKEKFVDNVKSEFVKSVNEESIKQLKKLNKKIETNKPQIEELRDSIPEAKSTIEDMRNHIENENKNSKDLQKYLAGIKSDLPKISNRINELQTIVAQSKSITQTTKDSITSEQEDLVKDINQIETTNNEIQLLLNNLRNINDIDIGKSSATTLINEMNKLNNSISDKIDTDIDVLNKINDIIPNKPTSKLIDDLESLRSSIKTEINYLNDLKEAINNDSSKDAIDSTINQLSEISNQVSIDIIDLSNEFYSNTYDSMGILADSMETNLNNINSVLTITKDIIPQINKLADSNISTSKAVVNQREQLSKKFTDIDEKLDSLDEKLDILDNDDIDEIMDIIDKNPDSLPELISSPVDVKSVEIYNSGLFGYGVTPFYTVLAIWVGVTLTCSIVTVKCREFEDGSKINLVHKYFSKLLLFLIISLIQTIIIITGDIYLVGIHPENTLLMYIISLVSSLSFSFIVYTFVYVFGNIGKGAAVVMMVFQIAGAGGLYPIATLPKIFGVLEPLWPFTYSINGMREAIAGPIWSNVYTDIRSLLSFVGLSLIFALLKKPLHKLMEKSEMEFEKSGLGL
ncbi:YhgE/Pip domain-containing protein [Clostridium sp. cel8]|uniref:YhgE/Pip domain-containing protein n=1 Tax=Clostridium sp. cel8 TaxID=2663123 RepID=UPI001FABB643|nr:YhgE/Pip domain-containing protein [Clostridium sp. cel8]